jgi:hypothetical protein
MGECGRLMMAQWAAKKEELKGGEESGQFPFPPPLPPFPVSTNKGEEDGHFPFPASPFAHFSVVFLRLNILCNNLGRCPFSFSSCPMVVTRA